jgi:hypothetical protein
MKIKVSNGEIVDKFTILQIKLSKSDSKEKTNEILKEIDCLESVVQEMNIPQDMIASLKNINLELWKIEDEIRLCEKNQQFDDQFISLARSVYLNNDKRFSIKSMINEYTHSDIKEQKILPEYQ